MASGDPQESTTGRSSGAVADAAPLAKAAIWWLDRRSSFDTLVTVASTTAITIGWRLAGQSPLPAMATYDSWTGFMAIIVSVAATLFGFSLTAVTLALTVGGGNRGKRVLNQAHHTLISLLGTSIAVALACLIALTLLSAMDPAEWDWVGVLVLAGCIQMAQVVIRLCALLYFSIRLVLLDYMEDR